MSNKVFDSPFLRAYKPAPRRGDGNLLPGGCSRVGLFFDIVDREKGCVGGGPGNAMLWTQFANASNYVVASPSSGNRYAFVFGILTLSIRRGPRGPRRMGEVNLRV